MAVLIVCPNPDCRAPLPLSEAPASGSALTCERCGRAFTSSELAATLTLAGSPVDPAVTQDHARASEAAALEQGPPAERLGRFEVVRELGEGAFGKVYQAHDPQLDRDVAVKVAKLDRGDSSERVKRFLREAKAAAGLRHPHIVPLYEFGQDGDRFFIASAFINGQTLQAALVGPPSRGGPATPQVSPGPAWGKRLAGPTFDLCRSARLIRALAEALAYAHGEGIVHRDVKPANVMLDERDQPLLMDFGLASRQEEAEQLTHAGAVMGTPRYMSPEQAKGHSASAGPASDQYSLGVMLFELLTGRPLFEGTVELVMFHHQETEPRSPRSLNPAVPRDLETICLKCLEKDPAKRYGSCQDLADDLRRWLDGEPVTARRIGTLERMQRWTRKNPLSAVLTATVAILLLVGTGLAWSLATWALGEAETAKQKEQETAEKAADLAREQIETSRQLTRARANLFTAQLRRVAQVYEKDPIFGYELLHDYNACPIDLRDFAWGWYARYCKRNTLTLSRHTSSASSVAFSPDGKTLVSGSEVWDEKTKQFKAGEIKLWDVETGQEKASLRGPRRIGFLAFSNDGKTLAAGGLGTINLCNIATKQELATLKGFGPVAFSPDGKLLASADHDNLIKLWDVASGQEHIDLKGHGRGVYSVAFSHNGKMLASASGDNTIQLWDVATGKEMATLKGLKEPVWIVAFTRDGNTLVSGGRIGSRQAAEIKLWDIGTKQERATHKIQTADLIYSMTFNNDGTTLALTSGNVRGTIGLWDVATGREKLSLKWHRIDVRSVAFSPDGKALASAGDMGGTIQLWDLATKQDLATLKGSGPVAFRSDGKILASSAGQQSANGIVRVVKLWDAVSWQELTAFQCEASALGFSPDGKILASGSTVGEYSKYKAAAIKLWDVTTGQQCAALIGPTGRITAVAFSKDGKLLAASGDPGYSSESKRLTGETKLWDVQTRQELISLKAAGPAAFSNDNKTLASASFGDPSSRHVGVVKLWDMTTWREHALKGARWYNIYSVAFSPDGKTLAWGSGQDHDSGELKVCDVITGERADLQGHTDAIGSVAFSPDGKTLASGSIVAGSNPGEIKLWDVTTGQERASLQGHWEGVHSLAFKPGGKLLASGSSDGTIRLWDATTGPEYAIFKFPRGTELAFTKDGKTLAAKGGKAWDIATGYEITPPNNLAWVSSTEAISPDGKMRAVSTRCTVQLTEAATGRLLATFFGHTREIRTVLFSPNGRLLASSSGDNSVRLWNVPEVK